VTRHNGVDNQTALLVRGKSERERKKCGETKDSRESSLRVEREGGEEGGRRG
jgi:hypothetical protein